MPDYRITWEIDITAASPEEAAGKALLTMRNPQSTATFFEVRPRFPDGDLGPAIEVDLDPQ